MAPSILPGPDVVSHTSGRVRRPLGNKLCYFSNKRQVPRSCHLAIQTNCLKHVPFLFFQIEDFILRKLLTEVLNVIMTSGNDWQYGSLV